MNTTNRILVEQATAQQESCREWMLDRFRFSGAKTDKELPLWAGRLSPGTNLFV